MATGFNPEQTANDIRSKSFLKSRCTFFGELEIPRETTGSIFFRDNKIRSCSYIKETENALKAVPFYQKRDNTLYPTPSIVHQSWNANVHSHPETVYAGMGSSKPLSSVPINPFSMTPRSLETQWVSPISDPPIQTPPKLRLDIDLKEM